MQFHSWSCKSQGSHVWDCVDLPITCTALWFFVSSSDMTKHGRLKKRGEEVNRVRQKGVLGEDERYTIRKREETSHIRGMLKKSLLTQLCSSKEATEENQEGTATPAYTLINISHSQFCACVFWTKFRDGDLATCLIFNRFSTIFVFSETSLYLRFIPCKQNSFFKFNLA